MRPEVPNVPILMIALLALAVFGVIGGRLTAAVVLETKAANSEICRDPSTQAVGVGALVW